MPTMYPTKRHTWLAAFLSLLLPGLGQLYCGAFVRGLGFLVVGSGAGLFGLLALIPGLKLSGTTVLTIQAAALAVYAVAVLDAFRLARRTPEDYPLKDFNRWYAYVMFYVAVAGGQLFSMLYAREHLVQPFKLGGASMYPTLWRGDQVLAARTAYLEEDPAPGDIVIFHNPADRSQVFVKRVVAIAGDTIELRDNEVYVNGEKLRRDPAPAPSRPGPRPEGTVFIELNRGARYSVFLQGTKRSQADMPKITVPPHQCFVLGDNRTESLDSRSFGPIPVVGVLGKVNYRYAPLAQMGSVRRTEPATDAAR